jgi:hypothetical protein
VTGEADDERQHDQGDRNCNVRVAVQKWRDGSHGGADAERECDPFRRRIVEVEPEWSDDEERGERVVEDPMDPRRCPTAKREGRERGRSSGQTPELAGQLEPVEDRLVLLARVRSPLR